MLIGLSGYARSGKDTVAAILAARGFRRVAFADKLRDVALAADPIICLDAEFRPKRLSVWVEMFGWEGVKDKFPEVRRTLQALGTGVRDHVGENSWVDAAFADYYHRGVEDVVVSDVRFKNEAAAIHRVGGWVVRVERPGFGPANDHVSERDLDGWPFWAHLVNDGTRDDLVARVADLWPRP